MPNGRVFPLRTSRKTSTDKTGGCVLRIIAGILFYRYGNIPKPLWHLTRHLVCKEFAHQKLECKTNQAFPVLLFKSQQSHEYGIHRSLTDDLKRTNTRTLGDQSSYRYSYSVCVCLCVWFCPRLILILADETQTYDNLDTIINITTL